MKSFINIMLVMIFMGQIFHRFKRIQEKALGAKLSEIKETNMMVDWLLLLLSVLVFIYLSITLLLPEKF